MEHFTSLNLPNSGGPFRLFKIVRPPGQQGVASTVGSSAASLPNGSTATDSLLLESCHDQFRRANVKFIQLNGEQFRQMATSLGTVGVAPDYEDEDEEEVELKSEQNGQEVKAQVKGEQRTSCNKRFKTGHSPSPVRPLNSTNPPPYLDTGQLLMEPRPPPPSSNASTPPQDDLTIDSKDLYFHSKEDIDLTKYVDEALVVANEPTGQDTDPKYRKAPSPRLFCCPVCGSNHNKQYYVYRHLRRVHKTCNRCMESFPTANDLTEHQLLCPKSCQTAAGRLTLTRKPENPPENISEASSLEGTSSRPTTYTDWYAEFDHQHQVEAEEVISNSRAYNETVEVKRTASSSASTLSSELFIDTSLDYQPPRAPGVELLLHDVDPMLTRQFQFHSPTLLESATSTAQMPSSSEEVSAPESTYCNQLLEIFEKKSDEEAIDLIFEEINALDGGVAMLQGLEEEENWSGPQDEPAPAVDSLLVSIDESIQATEGPTSERPSEETSQRPIQPIADNDNNNIETENLQELQRIAQQLGAQSSGQSESGAEEVPNEPKDDEPLGGVDDDQQSPSSPVVSSTTVETVPNKNRTIDSLQLLATLACVHSKKQDERTASGPLLGKEALVYVVPKTAPKEVKTKEHFSREHFSSLWMNLQQRPRRFEDTLKALESINTKPGTYFCPDCPYTENARFTTSISRHKSLHLASASPVQCHRCKQPFVSERTLACHLRAKHPDEITPTKITKKLPPVDVHLSAPPTYECILCECKRFRSKILLDKHERQVHFYWEWKPPKQTPRTFADDESIDSGIETASFSSSSSSEACLSFARLQRNRNRRSSPIFELDTFPDDLDEELLSAKQRIRAKRK